MVHVTSQGICVVTDSISYRYDDGGTKWVSKTYVLPHLDLLVTAVGLRQLSAAYVMMLGLGQRRDCSLDDIAADAQSLLSEIWEHAADTDNSTHGPTFGTVYIAGWSPSADDYTAFRFNSADNFTPQQRHSGDLAIYPTPDPTIQVTYPESLEDWVNLAEHVRQAEIDRDAARVLIGGRLVMTNLTRGAAIQTTIHEFDDSPELWDHYLRDLAIEFEHPPRPTQAP